MNATRRAILFAISTTAISAAAMTVEEALGQLESGANQPEQCAADFARGPAGEISRYQFLPSVWRAYGGGDPTNPTQAWAVASLVIRERSAAFEVVVRRPPAPRELYALWTAPGQFAKRGYDWQRLSPAVRERSQRFANLMEVKLPGGLPGDKPASHPISTNGLVLAGSVITPTTTNGGSVVFGKGHHAPAPSLEDLGKASHAPAHGPPPGGAKTDL